MIIGKVISKVISTRKHEALQGFKFLVIQPYYGGNKEYFVAADHIGAGEGELVLVSMGHAAQHALREHAPVDAVVVGIIDNEPELGTARSRSSPKSAAQS
ncbi:Ethanolamine utilization protein EutN/carboxysome structural protein Ccml [Caldalkalibacillus thermarum TA2.A1]|uniref:Ethanolamine utilization protein EutN/carboxysome structural protein Ccml n=1 Tax=Caldalkalibacillus thermarum (strain TA2.A1) TaxID=986075 RepID=F5L8G1_CALTT|nr:EutN/CcmL family microcompartment protein [Caldalkalibacillus thermarum]EGL82394.1 Ethanolamine utilization protein EutN/carboxysome structural protein Ccml [Caldalkalibacillus thermarum TA2.A1]QZT34270.1 EutN/CcmL family microcompartment protein [Caldalkalibacillus thermarum TA2.A1]